MAWFRCDGCNRSFSETEVENTGLCPKCGSRVYDLLRRSIILLVRDNHPTFTVEIVDSEISGTLCLACKKCSTVFQLDKDTLCSMSWNALATGLIRGIVEHHIVGCATVKIVARAAVPEYHAVTARKITLRDE